MGVVISVTGRSRPKGIPVNFMVLGTDPEDPKRLLVQVSCIEGQETLSLEAVDVDFMSQSVTIPKGIDFPLLAEHAEGLNAVHLILEKITISAVPGRSSF